MIETEHLLLRPLAPEDAPQIFAYRSDAANNLYQGWIPESLNEVVRFIERQTAEFNIPETWYQLAIVEKSSARVVGDLGVHFVDVANQQCEVGCTLGKEHQGRGLATAAMKAVVDLLFVELEKHRVTASVDPRNLRSIALVERLGFRREAHFRESLFLKGEWVDDVIYAVLGKEWL